MNQDDFMYGFNEAQFNKACLLITISCYMLFVGYKLRLKYRIRFSKSIIDIFKDENYCVNRIQWMALLFFVISTLGTACFLIPKMLFSLGNGYNALYKGYVDSVWISRLSFISTSSMCIGLAAKPNKNRVMIYFIIGSLNPIITFVQGERSSLVTYVLFVIFYYMKYDNWRTGKVDNKRIYIYMMLIFLSMFICLPFLYNYGMIRNGMNSNVNGMQGVLSFFDSQGGSFRVVGAAVKYQNRLPQKWYSFGALIDRFLNIFIPKQSENRALLTHSFADIITYLEEKWSYLDGYGMGSSYIAEIFYDFNWGGVIIVNLFIGLLLRKMNNYKNENIFNRSIFFNLFQNIMIMPRATFLRPLDVLFSSSTIIVYLLIFAVSKNNNHTRINRGRK